MNKKNKWYCRCGQINSESIMNCVNCNDPSSKGSDTPYDTIEVQAHPNPVRKRTKNIFKEPLKRIKIYSDGSKLILCSAKLIQCLFLLILSLPAIGFNFIDNLDLVGRIIGNCFLVPLPIYYMIFFLFPGMKIIFNRNTMECSVQRKFLLFKYWEKVYSLHEYSLIKSIQEYNKKETGPVNLKSSLLSSAITLSPSLEYDNIEWIETAPAIGLSESPSSETINIMAIAKDNIVDFIIEKAYEIFPENVIIDKLETFNKENSE